MLCTKYGKFLGGFFLFSDFQGKNPFFLDLIGDIYGTRIHY